MTVRQRIACLTLVAMLAAAGLTSTALVQDVRPRRLVVDVDDPRPLSAAARQLERQLGLAVTYEDGSYVAPGDIVDVTAQVRRDRRTEPRVLVMRGGAFRFEKAMPGTAGAGGVHHVLKSAGGDVEPVGHRRHVLRGRRRRGLSHHPDRTPRRHR